MATQLTCLVVDDLAVRTVEKSSIIRHDISAEVFSKCERFWPRWFWQSPVRDEARDGSGRHPCWGQGTPAGPGMVVQAPPGHLHASSPTPCSRGPWQFKVVSVGLAISALQTRSLPNKQAWRRETLADNSSQMLFWYISLFLSNVSPTPAGA